MQLNTIDRTKPPDFKLIDKISIIEPEFIRLDYGIPVYLIRAGKHELLRVDFIFDVPLDAAWFDTSPLIPQATNTMLLEGTKTHTAFELAEKLDFYGAYLNCETERHTSVVSLYTLSKYFENLLPLILDLLCFPIFPENELTNLLNKRKQSFEIENSRVENLARYTFFNALYGDKHPYGFMPKLLDFDSVTRTKIVDYFQQRYTPSNCRIIIAGNIKDEHISLLNKQFVLSNHNHEKLPLLDPLVYKALTQVDRKHFIVKNDSMQSAIRLGKALFNKLHPDYLEMKVVNTILGGYFGSRLMTNLREDKGLTYGIGSALTSTIIDGALIINTEVNADLYEPALNEIYAELHALRAQPVSDTELNLVRNYMMGEMLRVFDGAFSITDALRHVIDYDLDFSYFDQLIETIKTITPNRIQHLANQYLQSDSFVEVVAGKKVG